MYLEEVGLERSHANEPGKKFTCLNELMQAHWHQTVQAPLL